MFLVIRILKVYSSSNELYHQYIAIGIAGMIFYHFMQNIGMTFGLMPITGITLPFISYGGSSLLSYMVMMGIVFNISKENKKYTNE